MIFWLALGAALGTLGGAMHMVSRRARLLIFSVSLSVFSVSVLETFLADLLEGFGLEAFTDFIYYKRGGLEISGAVLGAILALVIPLVAGGRLKKVKTRIVELPKEERKKVNLLMLFSSAGLLLVLPFFLGKITNELLANVGLFVLLALGLNIVVGLAGILDLGYEAFFAVGGYTTADLT